MKKCKKILLYVFIVFMLCPFNIFARGATEKPGNLQTRYFVGSNGKYGIINDNFNVIIPAEYQFAYEFTGEVANVQIDDKTWGFVNKDNELVFSMKADMLNPLIDGWAKYETANNKYGFVNSKGEYLVKDCDWVKDFGESYGSVKKNGVCYYIDINGNMAFQDFSANYGYSFEDGYAVVNKNDKYGVISYDGNFIIPCIYNYCRYRGEEYWSVTTSDRPTESILLNEKGVSVGKTVFKSCSKVYNDNCFIHYKGEPNYVSRRYDIKADTVSEIYENFIIENNDGKMLVILKKKDDGTYEEVIEDTNGNSLCDMSFDKFIDEHNSIIWMQKDGKDYYVNSKGEIFIPD